MAQYDVIQYYETSRDVMWAMWRYLAFSGVILRIVALCGVMWRYVALCGVMLRYVALCGGI